MHNIASLEDRIFLLLESEELSQRDCRAGEVKMEVMVNIDRLGEKAK